MPQDSDQTPSHATCGYKRHGTNMETSSWWRTGKPWWSTPFGPPLVFVVSPLPWLTVPSQAIIQLYG